MKIIILNGMAFNCPDQVKVFHSNNMDEIADWLYHAADPGGCWDHPLANAPIQSFLMFTDRVRIYKGEPLAVPQELIAAVHNKAIAIAKAERAKAEEETERTELAQYLRLKAKFEGKENKCA